MAEAIAALAGMGYRCKGLSIQVEDWDRRGLPTERGMTHCLVEPRDIDNVGMLRRDPVVMRRYLEWEVTLAHAREGHHGS